MVTGIIVAAGQGKRFGTPKQFTLLKEKPVIDWCIETFETHEAVTEIILVLKDDSQKEKYLKRYNKISAVAPGGAKRQDSVLSGFQCINPEKTDIILIHDGARPLVGKDLIDRVIKATQEKGAAIPIVPIEETVKIVEGHKVLQTVNRSKLYRVQTPQGFDYGTLKEALEKAKEEGYYGTDEASLVERTGKEVTAVWGQPENIKITTLKDLKIAEAFLED